MHEIILVANEKGSGVYKGESFSAFSSLGGVFVFFFIQLDFGRVWWLPIFQLNCLGFFFHVFFSLIGMVP